MSEERTIEKILEDVRQNRWINDDVQKLAAEVVRLDKIKSRRIIEMKVAGAEIENLQARVKDLEAESDQIVGISLDCEGTATTALGAFNDMVNALQREVARSVELKAQLADLTSSIKAQLGECFDGIEDGPVLDMIQSTGRVFAWAMAEKSRSEERVDRFPPATGIKPRRISFATMTPQFLDGSMTVTRRIKWAGVSVGDEIIVIEKSMGLKKGEKQVVIGRIIVTDCRRERLDTIDGDDCIRHGFPNMSCSEFIDMFCEANDCEPHDMVTRIEFRKLPDESIEVEL